jgi:hypothetical protein
MDSACLLGRGKPHHIGLNQKQNVCNKALFSNQTFANALVNDLNQAKDANRTLKEIDNNSAAELFALFGMRDYHCDTNRDGVINGEELKCLNNIWKRHIPE